MKFNALKVFESAKVFPSVASGENFPANFISFANISSLNWVEIRGENASKVSQPSDNTPSCIVNVKNLWIPPATDSNLKNVKTVHQIFQCYPLEEQLSAKNGSSIQHNWNTTNSRTGCETTTSSGSTSETSSNSNSETSRRRGRSAIFRQGKRPGHMEVTRILSRRRHRPAG